MKIIKTLFVATFALVAGYGVYSTQQNAEMPDLAMANVEALAQNEGDGMLDYPNGCLDMPGHCFCYGYHPYEEKRWKKLSINQKDILYLNWI